VFGLGVVVFLTTTTLPQLAAVLEDASVPLPGATQALLALGTFLTTRPLLAAGTGLLCVAVLGWLAATPVLARQRLAMPLLGRVLMRGQMGSTCMLLARLLRGGIPLADAMPLASTVVSNAALRRALLDIVAQLRDGRTTGDALDAPGIFEPVLRQVLRVGEESGELPTALETIGTRYQRSARRLVDRLAAALEPAVILLLAAAVGFVVYGAIAPMLRLTQTLG
jgi:type II secretory pathway component PulF